MLDSLFDRSEPIPKDFSNENEEQYFHLLKSLNIGKAITNMSEYLLEMEGIQGKSKVRDSGEITEFCRTLHFGSD
jgi:hypothetical protein